MCPMTSSRGSQQGRRLPLQWAGRSPRAPWAEARGLARRQRKEGPGAAGAASSSPRREAPHSSSPAQRQGLGQLVQRLPRVWGRVAGGLTFSAGLEGARLSQQRQRQRPQSQPAHPPQPQSGKRFEARKPSFWAVWRDAKHCGPYKAYLSTKCFLYNRYARRWLTQARRLPPCLPARPGSLERA
jgi:hypothetical protein